MNDTYRQAPELRFTRAKKKNNSGPSYFGWEPELWKYVNKELSGREGNCVKLINILLGTAEGFRVSQKWICEMAGLSKDGYYKARKKLEEKKMLIYDESANTITIDTEGMLKAYSSENKKNEGMLETYSQGIHETYSQSMLEKYPESISETYHNKKETKEKQKKEQKSNELFSAGAEKISGNLSQAKGSQSNPIDNQNGMDKFLEEWFGKGGTTCYGNPEWRGL